MRTYCLEMTDVLILEVSEGNPKNLKIYIFEKEKVFLKSFFFLFRFSPRCP